MQRVTQKVICALLSLLLITSGQATVVAQAMPMGDDSTAMAGMATTMADCGHPGADSSGERRTETGTDHAETMPGSLDCGGAENMACMGGTGSGQCVMTMVLAHTPAFSFSDALAQPVIPRPSFTYLSPFLDVITPPPDFLS